MPTILLKKSDTASAVPTTANLTNLAGGVEVAVNTADRRMFTMTSASAVVELGNNPTSLNITTGNLVFTGTAQRITGDFSNATLTSRVYFQNSAANGPTVVGALPSGSGSTSAYSVFNASDPTNSSEGQLAVNSSTDIRLSSTIRGTGTYLPMTFYTGGSERMRLDTSGNLGIGTTPSAADTFPFLQLGGTAGIIGAVNNYNLLSNAYYGSGGWKYVGTGNAVRYGGDTSGNHIFFGAASGTAGNAVTWLERMRIDSSGNVGIGKTASTNKLEVSGTISDVAGNIRAIPRTGSAKTSVYTLSISDVGQFVELGTGGGIDVPNGVFSTGDVVSVFNNTTGNRTISLTITTAYLAGTDADKASVTLATRGVATVLFISNSVCVVSGNVT